MPSAIPRSPQASSSSDQRAGHGAALAAAAGAFGERVGHESQLVGVFEHRLGQFSRLVGLSRARPDLVFRELVHGLYDEGLLFARFEVDHRFSDVPAHALRASRRRTGIIDEMRVTLAARTSHRRIAPRRLVSGRISRRSVLTQRGSFTIPPPGLRTEGAASLARVHVFCLWTQASNASPHPPGVTSAGCWTPREGREFPA